MPLVDPLPELTVLREFWLPWGVRFPSVRLGACVLLWWEEAGDGGTSPSPFDTEDEEEENRTVGQVLLYSGPFLNRSFKNSFRNLDEVEDGLPKKSKQCSHVYITCM